MSEKKKAETKTAKTKTVKKAESKPKKEKAPTEPLVVFAIRLRAEERDEIHAAAGDRNATQFVRAIALAAAREDDAAIKTAISEAKKLRA
jgi:hypothetical protein